MCFQITHTLLYLNFRGYRGEYFGIDINQTLLDSAKSRFPNISISHFKLGMGGDLNPFVIFVKENNKRGIERGII